MLRWNGVAQPSSNPPPSEKLPGTSGNYAQEPGPDLITQARVSLSPTEYKLWDWFRLTEPQDPPLIRQIVQGTGLSDMQAVRAWAFLWRQRYIRRDRRLRWFAVWNGIRVPGGPQR